jgi:hypothetical protein
MNSSFSNNTLWIFYVAQVIPKVIVSFQDPDIPVVECQGQRLGRELFLS